jgi:hypothetical protein
VKIGAIEHRSKFRTPRPDSSYLGIEVGADASADVNLDDFMVLDNDPARASTFFRDLLFRHVRATLIEDDRGAEAPQSPDEFVRRGFTQTNAFGELARAAEGVPRDAMNIASIAAQRAMEGQISMNDVRAAARRWFLRDKEAELPDRARTLLNWCIDRVIGERRARAFLLRQGGIHPLIGTLYDQRVLHVVKKSIAGRDEPGVRYDVYQLDFGCYVELMTTARAPEGMFEAEHDDGNVRFVEVPQDDYRSIRRAILHLAQFEEEHPEVGNGYTQPTAPPEATQRLGPERVPESGDMA